jgi:hypothetical protein
MAMDQAHANDKLNRSYLQFDNGIDQFAKVRFAGGVPYWYVKVLDQARTHCFIQDQEQDIPAMPTLA